MQLLVQLWTSCLTNLSLILAVLFLGILGSFETYDPALLNSVLSGTHIPILSSEHSQTYESSRSDNFLSYKTSDEAEIDVSYNIETIISLCAEIADSNHEDCVTILCQCITIKCHIITFFLINSGILTS